jgi:hypothetical protein
MFIKKPPEGVTNYLMDNAQYKARRESAPVERRQKGGMLARGKSGLFLKAQT